MTTPNQTKRAETLPGRMADVPTISSQRPTIENAPYDVYGKELLNSALYGALLMGGGSALYHLVNGARTADPASVIRNPAPIAVAKKKKEDDEAAVNEEAPALKVAEAPAADANPGFLKSVHSAIGHLIPTQFLPDITMPTDAGPESPTIAHRGWRTAANYLAAIGGGMGGAALVNSMRDSKKKRDLDDEVEDARKEYFEALTGKAAAALDALYEKHAEPTLATPDSPWYDRWNPFMWNWGNVAHNAQQTVNTAQNVGERGLEGAWAAALISALGSGAIGAKYMYDQTKSRTQADNLNKAQKSRARLRSIQQTPWVDPEELASIAGR